MGAFGNARRHSKRAQQHINHVSHLFFGVVNVIAGERTRLRRVFAGGAADRVDGVRNRHGFKILPETVSQNISRRQLYGSIAK
ncbi:MAG: hypothetical protein H7335_06325 [Massilia sp.]|nr:hypothetical protein [Massilia sp.]